MFFSPEVEAGLPPLIKVYFYPTLPYVATQGLSRELAANIADFLSV
jgi:hypothetical protein